MNLLEIMRTRRSMRQYTQEPLLPELLEQILSAGLLSASSRALRPWELIVIQQKEVLKQLSECRVGAAKMLEGAACAVVVVADTSKSDVWIEDCAIVMSNMHLMADSLGVGSCWIQARLRNAANQPTETYVRELLNFPEGYALEAILSLGKPAVKTEPYQMNELNREKIHWEQF